MLCSGLKLITSWSQDSLWSNQMLSCLLLCLIHSCESDEVGGEREDDLRVKQSWWTTTNWWLCFWFWGCNHPVTTAIWCKTAEWGNVMTVIIPVQWHHRGVWLRHREVDWLNEWIDEWMMSQTECTGEVSEQLPVWPTEWKNEWVNERQDKWINDSIVKQETRQTMNWLHNSLTGWMNEWSI